MKEVKYIPLDLVKADKNPNIIWKVKDVSQDKRGNVLYRVVAAEDNDAFIYLYEHQIASVPLTPEILEKNGWNRTQIFIDDDGLEFHTYIDDERCLDLQYYPQYKKFAAFICKQEVLSDIEYVHQLQHLLFGLGLPMDLKV